MRFFEEVKTLVLSSIETGKEIVFFIILANLALIFAFTLKGSEDVVGLLIRMSFLTMFIPLLFTIRKHFS